MDDVAALHRRIAELEAEVERLSIDPAYGCLTRPGLERRWRETPPCAAAVVYTDLDHFGELNAAYGHAAMNARVRAALAALTTRASDAVFGGRYFSGDELLYVVPLSDATGFALRMQRAFRAQGIGATIVILPIGAGDVQLHGDRAAALVTELKHAGLRGQVERVIGE